MWKQLMLWFFVINRGVAFGTGVYEARVVIPPLADIPPSSWPNTGAILGLCDDSSAYNAYCRQFSDGMVD
ncbi:MAG TPA: hypothetical protein VEG60_13110 [Candidatus Binatia bacterium]|nr:hypothetical protein [Candidatus Binatia bacterium]